MAWPWEDDNNNTRLSGAVVAPEDVGYRTSDLAAYNAGVDNDAAFFGGDTTSSSGGFGGFGGLAGIGQIAGGLGALGSAWTGYKALGLAEDQFGFEKAATNRNIANQGLLANNAITNANEVGLALGGGAMTPDQIAASKAATQAKLVDTSAIG